MHVSNEPCTDKATVRRVELARKRWSLDLDVYGQCRDSTISFGAVQTLCVCEPVGMDHCVPTESTAVRKTEIYAAVQTCLKPGLQFARRMQYILRICWNALTG